jgi:hypothetical protein
MRSKSTRRYLDVLARGHWQTPPGFDESRPFVLHWERDTWSKVKSPNGGSG